MKCIESTRINKEMATLQARQAGRARWWALCLLIMTFSWQSASAVEPWVKWARNPLTIPVKVELTDFYGTTNIPVFVSLADGSVSQKGIALTCSDAFTNAPAFTANLKVRREYQLTVIGTNFGSADIKLSYKPTWTPPGKSPKAIRQKTYRLIVDRAPSNGEIPVRTDYPCQYYSNTWTIELNEQLPANWRLEDGSDDPSPAAGDARWPELGPGKSPQASKMAFAWSVGLGRLMDGRAAGRLSLRENALTTNVFGATNIFYTVGDEISRMEVDLITATTNSPTLRQIRALQTFVDIVSFTNATELRFYRPSQIGTATNSLGHYTSFSGNPFVVWAIIGADAPSTNRLQVVERRNGNNLTNDLQFTGNNTAGTWSLRYGSGQTERLESRSISFDTSSGTNRIENVEIKYASAGVADYKAKETYRLFQWGFELIETRVDPDNNTGTPNDLVNTIEFNTDPLDEASYGRPKWFVYPDGYWERRIYDDFFVPGAVRKVLSPRHDGPATPAEATEENSVVALYEDYNLLDGVPEVIMRTVPVDDNVGFRKEIHERMTSNDLDLSAVGKFHNEGTTIFVGDETSTYNDIKGFGYSFHNVYENDGRSAGRYSYFHGGTFSSSNLFTVNSTHAWDGPDWRKSTIYGGQQSYLDSDVNNVQEVSSAEGQPLYWLDYQRALLHPNRSWKETEIYQAGSVVQKEFYIFTGVAGPTNEPQFELLYADRYLNDALGHATNITRTDASTAVTRVLYEANYRGTNTFDGELKLWEKDEYGIKTLFAYDSQKRLSETRKEGVAATAEYAAQPDIVRNITYNAAGDVLTDVSSAGSAPAMATTTAYDFARRPVQSTDTNGLTTQLAYELGGRRAVTTLPSGSTRIEEKQLDRRLKSITGTGVVAEYHDWAYRPVSGWGSAFHIPGGTFGGDITVKHQIRYAFPGGPRLRKEGIDWIDKTSLMEVPDWEAGKWITDYTRYYDFDGVLPHLPNRTLHSRRPSFPVEEYRYDFEGNTNTVLTPVAQTAAPETDDTRIVRAKRGFAKISGIWYRMTTNTVYRTSGNNTQTQVGLIREKLNGFTSGLTMSERWEWDPFNNYTYTQLRVDRSAKTLTEAINPPESTLNATNITVNGLLQRSSTATVMAREGYEYDGLGRVTAVTNSLGFAERTSFNSYGQVASTTASTGVTTTYDYYLNGQTGAGQVKSATVAGTKMTRYAYTARGELFRTWGDVPYPEERSYTSYGELDILKTFQAGSGWNGAAWPTSSTGNPNLTTWNYQSETGLLVSKTDHLNRTVTFTYEQGLLKTRQWARGVITTNLYNDLGELTGVAYNNSTPGYQLTNNTDAILFSRTGQPVYVSDASGVWRMKYDVADRLTEMKCTSGLLNGVTVTNRFHAFYGRDQLQVLITSQPTLTQAFGYDDTGRLTNVAYENYTAGYTYKPNSDLLQATAFRNNGATVLTTTRNWQYGSRLGSIENSTGAPVSVHAYQYDELDRRRYATLHDGSTWDYTYNDRNEVASGKHWWLDGTRVVGQQYEYDYDSIGNRTAYRSGGNSAGANLRTTAYVPNELNQYVLVTNSPHKEIMGAAAASDNVTVAGLGTDRHDQYFRREVAITGTNAQWKAVSIVAGTTNTTGGFGFPPLRQTNTYDLDGNLTYDMTWTYEWDAENRLSTMTMTNLATVANANRLRLEFAYDHQGRRVSKKVLAWNGAGFSTQWTHRYVYDGWNLLAAVGTANVVQQSYVWGLDLSGTLEEAGGIGGLLIVRDHNAGTHLFPGYDGNGNITVLIDAVTTKEEARYEYGPFGEVIRASGLNSRSNPFLFSTKFYDWETELLTYLERPYSSRLGRWLSRDPIGEKGGLNLYVFVGNNPINFFDPFGATAGTIADGGAAISAGGALTLASVGVGLLGRVQAGIQAFDVIQEGMLAMADDQVSEEEMAYMLQGAGKALASALVGKYAGAALSKIGDKVVRFGYEKAVQGLSTVADQLRKQGVDAEQIARTVSGMRRAIGAYAKTKTSSAMKETIRQRNLKIYGDELGPSVDWLRSKGKSWDQIIDSAPRPGGFDLK